jgi:hypothetical protein
MKLLLNIMAFSILTLGDMHLSKMHSNALMPKKVDSEIANIDTLLINDHKFIQALANNRFNSLIAINGDTIIKSEDYYSEIKFLDINSDGYDDIRVYAISNTPNQCDNYLFDREAKIFRMIENCPDDIQKIGGSDFYQSYSRAGCADMNWESYLGKVENYEFVRYGYMHGYGCEFNIKENPQLIEIYKVEDSRKAEGILFQSLPYLKHIPNHGDKWDFIEKYWKGNFKLFER